MTDQAKSQYPATAERWGVFEVVLAGPAGGNPYLDVTISATFTHADERVVVPGFYDGEGRYLVRFSPAQVGHWAFSTQSSAPELDRIAGSFDCGAPAAGNHGPVRVNDRHFSYADGSRYVPIGTTAYAWIHQDSALQEQTLETLGEGPFNKLRMCVFPKDYVYNENEPLTHPFQLGADGKIDSTKPSFAFFQHLDKQIERLGALGIEADLILFHPYDRWGYSEMSEVDDLRYLRYVISRLAAYHNVWWSLANEYDFMLKTKPLGRWERFFEEVTATDPSGRLTSIHNGVVDTELKEMFDHSRPEITHVSIQHYDVRRTEAWRSQYSKPLVNDEPEYEGDVPNPWGNISAQELVHRFWLTAVYGGYAGHGETYMRPDHVLWWSKGGSLQGESPARIGFLRQIMESSEEAWEPLVGRWEWKRIDACQAGPHERIIYLGAHQPREWARAFPVESGDSTVELIDTWEMTITPLELTDPPYARYTPQQTERPQFGVELPGRPYLALRIRSTSW